MKNSSTRRSIIARGLLLLVSCAVGLLLAEAILRLLPWKSFQRKLYLRSYYVFTFDPENIEFDETSGYRMKANLQTRFEGKEFSTRVRTNSLGFRDDEQSLRSPRAILVGDSYLFGWGVEEEDNVEKQLEELTGLRMLNTGVPGYGNIQQLLLLEHLSQEIPLKDMPVIILLSPNDFRDNLGYGWGIYPVGVLQQGQLEIVPPRRGAIEEIWFKWHQSLTRRVCRHSRLCSLALVVSPVDDIEKTSDAGRFPLFQAILSRLVKLKEEHGFCPVFFGIPPAYDDRNWYPGYSERIGQLLEAEGIPYHDLKEVLSAEDCYYYDRHWNLRGHRKAAEFIYGKVFVPETKEKRERTQEIPD